MKSQYSAPNLVERDYTNIIKPLLEVDAEEQLGTSFF